VAAVEASQHQKQVAFELSMLSHCSSCHEVPVGTSSLKTWTLILGLEEL